MFYILILITGLIVGSAINAFSDFYKLNTDFFKHYHLYFYKKTEYVFVGAVEALLFVYILVSSDSTFEIVKYCFIAAVLTAAAVVDIKHKLIPNKLVVLLFTVGTVIALGSFNASTIINSLLSVIITVGVLLLLYFLSRGGIGMGDVKLIAATGMLLELQAMVSVFFISVILSGLAGVILIIGKRIDKKEAIPFAPFLLAGFVIMVRYI